MSSEKNPVFAFCVKSTKALPAGKMLNALPVDH